MKAHSTSAKARGKFFRYAVGLVFMLLFLTVFSSAGFAGTPWRFVVTGDSRGSDNGVNTTILSELAAEIVSEGAELVIFPGDLVDGHTDPATLKSQLMTWRATMQPVYDAGIGVYPVRGNHDDGSVSAWNEVFTGSYALPANGPAGEENLTYSAAHRNAFVVGLDQYVTSHRVNQTWLDGEFAANTNPHVFVLAHEPAFKVQHTDCMDDYPADRNAFWQSIADADGRTYFCGHDHYLNHARIDDGDGDPDDDLHQYVVGTAGAPLRDWAGNYDGDNGGYDVIGIDHVKQYGYILGEIDGLDVTLTWMDRVAAGTYVAGSSWSYTAVPEPATMSLVALGACLGLLRKRTLTRR